MIPLPEATCVDSHSRFRGRDFSLISLPTMAMPSCLRQLTILADFAALWQTRRWMMEGGKKVEAGLGGFLVAKMCPAGEILGLPMAQAWVGDERTVGTPLKGPTDTGKPRSNRLSHSSNVVESMTPPHRTYRGSRSRGDEMPTHIMTLHARRGL